MKTLTFDMYSDPGHGWLKVKRDLLTKLGINTQISSYSYQRHENVYLEEDCDMSTFIDAMKEIGVTVKYREKLTDKSSKIRSYNRYTNSTIS